MTDKEVERGTDLTTLCKDSNRLRLAAKISTNFTPFAVNKHLITTSMGDCPPRSWVQLLIRSLSSRYYLDGRLSVDRQAIEVHNQHQVDSAFNLSGVSKQSTSLLKDCAMYIVLHGKPISELRNVNCHMRSHSVTSHPTWVNTPHLNTARQIGTQFTYPKGMEG